MLNLIGSQFDLANIVHAVLAECEHRRRAAGDDLPDAIAEIARRKLASIHAVFDEMNGDPSYWRIVEDEIMNTALPQYVAIAERQNGLERSHYGVWRGGDLAARATFALMGLTIGGIIVAVPFIPIFIDEFAFFLALSAWFYPELKKLLHDFGYVRHMNRIVNEAARYQRRCMTEYVTAGSVTSLLNSQSKDRSVKRA